MGLEFVEIMVSVEEKYHIEIDESIIASLVTFGDFTDYVAGKLNVVDNPESSNDDLAKSNDEVIEQICKHTSFLLTPDTEIRDVFPQRKGRLQLWKMLGKQWGQTLPVQPYKHNYNLGSIIGAILFVPLLCLWIEFLDRTSLWQLGMLFVFVWTMLVCWLSWHYRDIPKHYKTVTDITRLLIRERQLQAHKQDNTDGLQIPESELEKSLKELFGEVLAIPFDKITRDKKLSELLNM
ncbi:MAG: acyl carrier protein [Planctomycetaceae bacterium]|jgi:hypothetical protein|nr:acyl carrier protein [Planctomycetaceae bacterium]